jgi:hypothetical protein
MEPVADTVDRFTQQWLRQLPRDEFAFSAWPLVCGVSVSGRTKIQSAHDGILTVLVSSREWQAELHGLKSQYLERFHQLCPGMVSEIRFIIAP